ncbi:MAG: class I adenylate-forming enzyme family protein [Solirubrobacteraceae bacterium]
MEHWLSRAAAMHPDRLALLSAQDRPFSYAELRERALEVAGGLLERGVSPGERVALTLAAGEELVAAVHGCMLAGAVAVPIDLRLSRAEREARTGGARLVVDRPLCGSPPGLTQPELTPLGLSQPGLTPLVLEQVAVVVHTSGTTAAPRPVALTFGNWLASALGSAVALGLDVEERWLCPMPLVHVGGLSTAIRSAIYGTTVVLHDRFDTESVLTALMEPGLRITLVSLVPTMLSRLLEAGLYDPPTLRWALLGGGPIAEALLDRARDAGVRVAPSYGMSEGCSQIATHGWPLPGVEVRVAGAPRASYGVGELLVRGPTIAPGALGADGWLHTGDLGTLDERGRLTITGRIADTIISGGENVAPGEVETALLEHPAVHDAAVFGRADADWGEAIVASVVLRDGVIVTAEELRSHCAARLAPFKVPKAIRFIPRLPRSETGKLLRGELG